MFELTIKVSNEEKSLTKKHVIYEENIVMSTEDATLAALVKEVVEEFGQDVETVQVRTLMVI